MSVPSLGFAGLSQRSAFGGNAGAAGDQADLLRSLQQVSQLSAQSQQLGLPDVEGTGPTGFLTGALDYLSRPQSAVLGFLTGMSGGAKAGEPTGPLQRAAAALAGQQQFRGGDLFAPAAPNASIVEKLLRAVPGFAVDVATDPLTYLTLGRGGTLRGAGAAAATEAQVRRQAQRVITPPLSQAVTPPVTGLGTATEAARQRARGSIDLLTQTPVVPMGAGRAQSTILKPGMGPTEAAGRAPYVAPPVFGTIPQSTPLPTFMGRRFGEEQYPGLGADSRVAPLRTEPMDTSDLFVQRVASAAGEGQLVGGSRGARDAITRVLEERYTPEEAARLTRTILSGTTGEVRGGIGVRVPFLGKDSAGAIVPAGESVTRRVADLTPGAGYMVDDIGLRSMAEVTRNIFNGYRSSKFFAGWSKLMNGRFGQEYAAVIRNSTGKEGMSYDSFKKLVAAQDSRVAGLSLRDTAAVGVLQTVKQMLDSADNADEVTKAAENYYHMGDLMALAPNANASERLGFEIASSLRLHGENMFDELLTAAERAGVEVGSLRALADNYVPRPLSAKEIAKRKREGKPVSTYDAQAVREMGMVFENGKLRSLPSPEVNARTGREVFETNPLKVAAQQYASYSEYIAKLNLVADLKDTGLLTQATEMTVRKANLRKIDQRLANFRGTVAELAAKLADNLTEATAAGDTKQIDRINAALNKIASSDEAINSILSTIDNTSPDEFKKIGNLVSVMRETLAASARAGAALPAGRRRNLLTKNTLGSKRTVGANVADLVEQGMVPVGVDKDVRLPAGLSNTFASATVRDAVDKYFRVQTDPSTIRKFFDNVYMPYYTLFKTYATVGRPGGYHARNLMGASWNNYLGDISAVDHKLSARALDSMRTTRTSAEEAVAAVRAGKPSGLAGEDDQLARYIVELARSRGSDVATYEIDQFANYLLLKKLQAVKVGDSNLADIFTAASDQGLFKTSRALGEIRAELRAEGGELVDSLLDPKYTNLFRGTSRSELNTVQQLLNRSVNFAPLQMSATAADLSENFVRLAAFIGGARRFGLEDGGQAANYLVKALHFDYQDLSDFERQVMKNIVPFYVWTRRNVPLQFTSLFNQPGKFNKLQFAQDELQNQFGAEGDTEGMGDLVPEWMRNKMGFVSSLTGPGGAPLVIGMESPAFDLNRFLSFGSPAATAEAGWKEAVSASNPLFKALVESVSGVDTFTGAPFSSKGVKPSGLIGLLPQEVQRVIPGTFAGETGDVRIPAVLPNLINDLIPLVGTANRLTPGGGQQERLLTNYLGTFAGLPVSTLTPNQAESELRTREERLRADIYKETNEVARQLEVDSNWLREALSAGYTFQDVMEQIQSGNAPRPTEE